MAAEILLKPSEAREHANRMKVAAEESRTAFQQLRANLSGLQDSFRGDAQVAFETRYNEWDNHATQMIVALEELEAWLIGAANTIEDIDVKLSHP